MKTPTTKGKRGEGAAIPFRIHPRAFKALGADLVTDDFVAIIELVKNAYDAYATVVDLRFKEIEGEPGLEIQDNGTGMSRAVLEDAWCTVATPYRQLNPVAKRSGKRVRRTSGAKGLGRLSAARLGSKLEMLTRSKDGSCWKVQVDWDVLSRAATMDQCVVRLTPDPGTELSGLGTILRLFPLRSNWDGVAIEALRENLARLLPPFETNEDFAIRVSGPGLLQELVEVQPPKFLRHPKYLIRGSVHSSGLIRFEYRFRAIKGDGRRSSHGECSWSQVRERAEDPRVKEMEAPTFGPFDFEIRAWDIGQNDTTEISEQFELKRATIRTDIRAYKGISVYRDGVLVLPKSEGARDWLGLDLRRVGRVGPRLSTTQLVGYVAISAASNPALEDTSDRERLASTTGVSAFQSTLLVIVELLENERAKDRREASKERRVVDLFQQLSARELIAGVEEVVSAGRSAADALPLVEEFGQKLEKAREEIEQRFIYYSRLATVGTIAQMLVHEVRNRTMVLGSSVEAFKRKLAGADEGMGRKLALAEASLAALDALAETFAPLANRQFRRRARTAVLEESVLRCLLMLEGELKERKIVTSPLPSGATDVAVDPGELDAVLLNLLSNAAYWTGHSKEDEKRIQIRSRVVADGTRIELGVHDNGPGVPQSEAERVFMPGVTNKPGGIGMGLTVASELVSEYGGKLGVAIPGRLGGASFVFDLPLLKPEKGGIR